MSLGETGEDSLSLGLFLVSDLLESSLLLLLDLELDLLLLDLELEEDLLELDFFESDLEDLLEGLLSFLDLESESLGDVDDSVFFSVLESFLSLTFLLGSLLLGSLDSLDSVFSPT